MAVDIKICGMTSAADARAAADLGADYLGFVFYPRSPRAVTPAQVRAIRAELPAEIRLVGVFVNLPRAAVLKALEICRLDIVQLHGDETAKDYGDLPAPVWRAVRREGAVWTPAPEAWPAAQRLLVDAAAPEAYGGTGRTADWRAAAVLARARPCMLAGGLTPANVAAAIRAVRPAGVDVASGVEAQPGRKDRRKMAAFIAAVRKARQEDDDDNVS
jgi:phosphoribosylanthranilate isomerase